MLCGERKSRRDAHDGVRVKGIHVRIFERFPSEFNYVQNEFKNEFQTDGDDSEAGKIFHKSGNDSRWKGFSMVLSRGRDLFLEVDNVKSEILY